MSSNFWSGKRVMITGVCGTVGQELLRQVLSFGVLEVVGIDNNESALFFLEEQYKEQDSVEFFICDIQHKESLENRMRGCDIVLHAAALKHVPLCEKSPRAAVCTNILGIQNIIDAAFAAKVERVLFTSSDKAVNPTNVMGTSKLMGERLITAANMRRQKNDPIFGVTRFGNVLGSSGSVIPIFKKQISEGKSVTVTHEEMSRFIMTLEQAVNLVLTSVTLLKGGEVFITKMPVIKIIDLAQVLINELAPRNGYQAEDIEVKITQPRPGEKMYEELLNDEEVRRSLESDDFFIVKAAMDDRGQYQYDEMTTKEATLPYTSDNAPAMSQAELCEYLYEHGLIEAEKNTKQSETQTKLRAI